MSAAAQSFWVVGARGMLGQATCATLTAQQLPYVASGSEVDVTSPSALATFAAAHPADVWLNCSAMTAVDACETDAEAAARNDAVNAEAPANLARLAAEHGARLVHVSTDYVFAGDATTPYAEAAVCAPKTAYGRAKHRGEQALWQALQGVEDNPVGAAAAAGEIAAVAAATNSAESGSGCGYVVRTSWLFGPHGNNFVATMLKLMQTREVLQVVDDQVGRPSYTLDLAEALIALGTGEAAGGTYHFANAGAVSWCGFARSILAEAQRRGLPLACRHVEPVTSAAFVRPAPRPAYSVLACDKLTAATGILPRPYAAALAAYFDAVTHSTNG